MPSVREKIDPAWARVRARLEDMKESLWRLLTTLTFALFLVEEGLKKVVDKARSSEMPRYYGLG